MHLWGAYIAGYMWYPLWFWKNVLLTAVHILVRRKQQAALAREVVQALENKFQGRFYPETARKIVVSHSIYNPMICDAFARLHGRTTTQAEQQRLIHYFTCSSVFDDFTDHPTLTDKQLWNISFAESGYIPTSFAEKAFQHCHLQLLNFVADKEAYRAITRQLFDAQMQSRLQATNALLHRKEEPSWVEKFSVIKSATDTASEEYKSYVPVSLSREELEQVTFAKGGLSVLLCSYYMDEVRGPEEQHCWYTIGTIIQLTNDLFDVWKDLQDGIDTLPNTMYSVATFRTFFLSRISAMKQAVARLDVSPKLKKRFLMDMAGIYSFGLIALDQFSLLTPETQPIHFKTYPREKLIIDMEKPSNLIAWFAHVYHHAKG